MSTHDEHPDRKAFDHIWTLPRLDAAAGTSDDPTDPSHPDDTDDDDTAPYDGIADADLTPEQLDCKYNPDGDGEHPTHTRAAWRLEVQNQNTSVGYWDWLAHVLEGEASEGHRADDSPRPAGA